MKETEELDYFTIRVPYEGYSRGYANVTIEAKSEDDALEQVKNGGGCVDYLDPVRDDTDKEWEYAEI